MHTYMEQRSDGSPFADSHREFLATFDQGEKEGDGRRDYIGMDCA